MRPFYDLKILEFVFFVEIRKTRPDFGRPSQTVRKNSGKQKHYSGKEKAAFRQKNETCEFVFAKLFQSKGQVGQTMDTC